MAPQNRVSENIRRVQNDLRQLADTSSTAGEALKTLNSILAEVAGGRFARPFSEIAQSVDQLMNSLQRAGISAQHVSRLRTELLRITAIQGRVPSVVQGVAAAGRGQGFTGVVRQQQEERARAAERIRLIEQATAETLRQEIRQREQAIRAQTTSLNLAERELRIRRGLITEQQRFLGVEGGAGPRDRRALQRRIGRIEARRAVAGGGPVIPEVSGQELTLERLSRSGFIPGGERGLRNVQQELDRLGLTAQKVTRPVDDVASGLRTFTVEAENFGGATSRARVRVDRLGRVMVDTSKRFRTFGSAIARDTVEVLKWTIAIGLVYTPIRLMNQLMQDAISLQNELAETQVVLAGTTRTTAEVFEAAAQVAEETGSSIVGVVKGYNEAFAATGSLATEADRAATTQILLRDSMVLSTLAGIEQSEALDTLIGSLRQAGLELDEGQKLLDQWVAVSKSANVTINTLASSFAIVGDAAAGAGINMEELSAISATLAEATKLSADETGNAIRGFISGFQQAKSEQVLASFGIAVKDVNGQLRGFTDIIEEVVRLREAGFLSDQDITQIGNVIGGGFRRGAQLTALIENYGRTLELINVAQSASGDSADALAVRLDTVEIAIQRLSNSVTELAQAFGTEGGFLSIAEATINTLTILVDVITALTKGMGAATPAIVAFGAAMAAITQTRAGAQFLNRAPGILARVATGGVTPSIERLRLAQVAGPQGAYARGATARGFIPGLSAPLTLGEAFQGINARYAGFVGRAPLVGGGLARAGLLGSAVPAALAGTSLVQGTLAGGRGDVQGQQDAYARAGGQIAGAVVGGLLTGANPIGIAIGSAAGGALVDTAVSDIGRITDEIARLESLPEPDDTETETTREEELQNQIDDLERQLTESTGIIQETQVNLLAAAGGVARFLGFEAVPEEFTAETAQLGRLQAGAGQIQGGNLIERLLLQGVFGIGAPSGEQVGIFEELQRTRERQLQLQDPGIGTDEISRTVQANRQQLEAVSERMGQAFVDEVLLQFQRGETNIGQFQEAQGIVSTLAQEAGTLQTAIDFAGLTVEAEEFLDVLLRISSDERVRLNRLANGIIAAQRALDEAEEGTEEFANAQRDLTNITNEFARVYQATALQVQASQIELAPIVDLGEITREEARSVVEKARELQLLYFQEFTDDPELLQELINRQAENLITISDGAEQQFLGEERIQRQFLSRAQEALGIGDAGASQFQFRDLRDQLNQQQLPALMQRYQQVVASFQREFGDIGFREDAQDVGLIMEDGFSQVHVDLSLLNLAMEDLIEVNEEQLEGIFNIPEGMTAFIPATGRTYFSDQPFPRGGTRAGPFPFEGIPEETADGISEDTLDRAINASAADIAHRLREQVEREPSVGISDPDALSRIDRVRARRDPIPVQLEDPARRGSMEDIRPGAVIGRDIDLGQILSNLFPESIPVTANIELENATSVFLDGSLIMKELQKRLLTDMKNARKRTGSFGYVVD